jgi:hypothetical protein
MEDVVGVEELVDVEDWDEVEELEVDWEELLEVVDSLLVVVLGGAHDAVTVIVAVTVAKLVITLVSVIV